MVKVLSEDYFSLILFRDIACVFRVKDGMLLERLARDIAMFSTERFTYRGLSERLGVDRETLKLYLYYLSSSMLTSVADVYTRAGKAVEKREKKLYFCEEGLRKSLTLDKEKGRSAENIVAWHLIKRGYGLKVFFKPYYWKNKHEVDFIYDDAAIVLPVEVKYRERVTSTDARALVEFMHVFDQSVGILVTTDEFGKDVIGGKDVFHSDLALSTGSVVSGHPENGFIGVTTQVPKTTYRETSLCRDRSGHEAYGNQTGNLTAERAGGINGKCF